MDALLYQFRFSHYCEKACWALEHKGVQYQAKNLLPGLHVYLLRGKVSDTSLPVLKIDDTYIQGSDHIIDFLDSNITANILTPADPALRKQARDWETFAADHLATPYAVFHYANLLQTPEMIRQRFTLDGPWYGPVFYAITMRRICRRIRELYKIKPDSVEQARAIIEAGLQKLEHHLQNRSYLVGDKFTRADLSVAALLSPLATPAQLDDGGIRPYPAIVEFRKQFADSPVIRWVNGLYQTHRHPE